MKKIVFLTVICFVFLLGAGCEVNGPGTDLISIEKNRAKEVVDNYMKHTLGMIPDSDLDFDGAKKYLTPDLRAQFTDSMFIPNSYCMQNGPDDVRITQAEFNEEMNWVDVVVEGKYDPWEWEEMWNFQVVPVEGNDWLINKIECLNVYTGDL